MSAFIPDFTIAQTIDATSFVLTDTSTGSDAAIVNRDIFCQTTDGTYLTPPNTSTDYIPFPLSVGLSIDVNDILPIDYALSITVNWLNISGNTLYTKTKTYCFTENDEQFDYQLTQFLVANQSILQDTNYVLSRFRFRMFIDAAVNAVEIGNDINSSQDCLNFAQEMINEQVQVF